MRTVQATPGGGVRISEAPAPSPGEGQVAVRIAFGGICGSDLHYVAHGRNGIYEMKRPLVLGHEVSGVVESVGPGLRFPCAVGERVVVHPARPTPEPGGTHGRGLHLAKGGSYLGSASTDPHVDGGFAERIVVDDAQLRPIPDTLPLRRAALAEPMAVALHGINRAPQDLAGKKVLVAGAGPIGSLVLVGLIDRGATDISVTDLAPRPLELALRIGASTTYQLGAQEPPDPESFDVIIESSGSPRSLASAAQWARRGGTIVQLGLLPAGEITTELAPLVSKEVTLHGSQRFDVELDEAVALLARRPETEQIVSHTFDADEAVEAFEVAADSSISSKVLLRFDPEAA